jgi:hypothetical protein
VRTSVTSTCSRCQDGPCPLLSCPTTSSVRGPSSPGART